MSLDAELGFIEGAWESLMRTFDAGTMGADQGWSFRIIMLLVTLAGIFVFSALIGVISSGLEEKLDELRKYKPLPGLMNLVTPLAFIHALGRDRMADLPRKPVSFRVVDNAGNAVPNALVAVIHAKSNRFLAEGAAVQIQGPYPALSGPRRETG